MAFQMESYNFNIDFYRSVMTVEYYRDTDAAAAWALKLLRYGYEGVEPVLENSLEEMAWALVQGRLDAMVAGAAGGKKKAAKQVADTHQVRRASKDKSTPPTSESQKGTSHNPSQGGCKTPLPRGSAKGVARPPRLQKENEKEKEIRDIPPTAREKMPTLKDVEEYFTASGVALSKKVLIEEAARFFNHFSAQGWVTGAGVPIQRWQAKANVWIGEISARKQRAVYSPSSAPTAPSHELSVYDRVDKVVSANG